MAVGSLRGVDEMKRIQYKRFKTMASAKALVRKCLDNHPNLQVEDFGINRSDEYGDYLVLININKINPMGFII